MEQTSQSFVTALDHSAQRHRSMDVDKALAIIDAAADTTKDQPGAGEGVAATLRLLRDRGVERETLVWFWKSLHGENYIGRSQNANAARNRIRLLLGRRPA